MKNEHFEAVNPTAVSTLESFTTNDGGLTLSGFGFGSGVWGGLWSGVWCLLVWCQVSGCVVCTIIQAPVKPRHPGRTSDEPVHYQIETAVAVVWRCGGVACITTSQLDRK